MEPNMLGELCFLTFPIFHDKSLASWGNILDKLLFLCAPANGKKPERREYAHKSSKCLSAQSPIVSLALWEIIEKTIFSKDFHIRRYLSYILDLSNLFKTSSKSFGHVSESKNLYFKVVFEPVQTDLEESKINRTCRKPFGLVQNP